MSFFAESYAGARAAFLHACAEAGGAVRSHRHPLPGPAGSALFLDEARFGPDDAPRVLFVASGTHGIEGFAGSAIQTSLLRGGLAAGLPSGVALVLVHAVNPYGFAWLRRVNEDNVDLNRNFADPGTTLPENPDYDRLYDVLNPTAVDDATLAAGFDELRRFEAEAGPAASYRAFSGGQYRHPRGIQYGGRTPTWSNRALRDVWARHAGGADVAAFVDLHSGLGPCGIGLLFQTAAATSREADLAAAWWPDVIRSDPATASDAALATGLIGPAFTAAHPNAAAVGVVLEFGTRPMSEVALAVVKDNWLEHHGVRKSDAGRAIGREMRRAFLMEDDDAWRDAVCARAASVLDAALAGMAATVPAAAPSATVRAARPDDVDLLVGFNVAMAYETEGTALPRETAAPGMVALLADRNRGRVFVVEDGGAVVAALMLTIEWSDWRNGFFWWIPAVYVAPTARRQGHYRRLHDHVRALAARDPEVCGLRLYVERENQAARATYERLGMRETHYRLYEETVPRRA